ncbi:methyltransferase domain-containing protein [Desulfovibrio sp. JC010]|uniref:methyltransferase domain-containing protein n=1 Tax=Desulfovibrio sp. JC010 TaxID=2593641 RepID=UPI0013D303E7|nr:class I SAM-dependent methyltransferase [Desulfovibrio sp. JC010]NDV27168.1 class I SAM-dependent methyltransferase [Desulfovibrio sp. JC010]
MAKTNNLLSDVSDYYTDKVEQFGASPQGVDWNGEESQNLRFDQLSKILEEPQSCSLNDLGCGYGAFVDYISTKDWSIDYAGYDVSEKMIHIAQNKFSEVSNANFFVGSSPSRVADFNIASGIFNVKMKRKKDEWENYILTTLDILHETCSTGFAFNCLTSYSDSHKMRTDLYYSDPCWLFDVCKKRYSRNVALLHDYDLYEFTILVRRHHA